MITTNEAKTKDILLVDDDPDLLQLLTMRLQAVGYSIDCSANGTLAMQKMNQCQFRVLITDLRMDGMYGFELFKRAQTLAPSMPVIIVTAHASIPEAVAATQQGVYAFLTKPVDKVKLLTTVAQALAVSGVAQITSIGDIAPWRHNITTRSTHMIELLNQVKLIAVSDANVLLLGESGTGKEVIAKAIHQASHRAKNPFVAINCGALPEQLLESELFGHIKGAFTGASADHQGLFMSASGGTLLLDEIGDMPPLLQVKLLRVLQEKTIRPVGSTRSIAVDVRIVSATHRNLDMAMTAGQFREDLYYRLNVVSLRLPPLRERREDIPLLANRFLGELAAAKKAQIAKIAPEAMEALMTYSWPGNIRQLANVVEQVAAFTTTQVIPLNLVQRALNSDPIDLPSLTEARNRFEHDYVVKLLQISGGSVSKAAQLAKRNRTDFYKILSRHGIKPTDYAL